MMKKKIMSVVMSIVMLFGMAFSFAGCQDNTAGLQAQIDEFQAKLEEQAEKIKELERGNSSLRDKVTKLEKESSNAPGVFYSLESAYEEGWLTQEDLLSIAYYNQGRNYNEEKMTEDYQPIPKYPEILSAETEWKIKETRAIYHRNHTQNPRPEASAEEVEIIRYYGTYHGMTVVKLTEKGYAYLQRIEFGGAGGVTIYYPNSNRITVWKEL